MRTFIMMTRETMCGLAALMFASGTAIAGTVPTFTGIGFLDTQNPFSRAQGISGDGSKIVGESTSANGGEAFIYDVASGVMVGIGDLPGGTFGSSADSASADGSVVVGESISANGREAFIYDAVTGVMTGLGDRPGGPFESIASGIIADGSKAVGSSATSLFQQEAFVYDTRTRRMIGLGDLPGSGFRSVAADISSDGRYIIGSGLSANGSANNAFNEGFVYDTDTRRLTGIGDLPGNGFQSSLTSLSADDATAAGNGYGPDGQEIITYDIATGVITARGRLPGSTFNSASGISSDGSTIVGRAESRPTLPVPIRRPRSSGTNPTASVHYDKHSKRPASSRP